MPSVFTIAAPFDEEPNPKCKTVKNGRTGCTIKMCRKSNGRWAFKAGTSQCPLTGGRQKNRNRKRRRRR